MCIMQHVCCCYNIVTKHCHFDMTYCMRWNYIALLLSSFQYLLVHCDTKKCNSLFSIIYNIILVRPLYVCRSAGLQTPPRPLDGLTLFYGRLLISYPGVTLAIFHEFGSKVKVTRGH